MTLPTHAGIVVIGGGIIGCSTAYHLARDHKADVVLLEQGKLTSGSTWHAAGLVGQLRSSASITRVLKYSVDLYKGLEAETGLATGWKMTGCLRLATNADRWTEYKRLATTAKSFGMDMQLLSPAEVKKMWPLLETGDLVGASWLPTDGQASPSDITQSLAKGARMHGAQAVRGGARHRFRDEGWPHRRGEHQSGRYCLRQGGELAAANGRGRSALWPASTCRCSRSSINTSSPKRSTALPTDAPTIRDPDRRTYFKEEVGGLVMGGYEPNPQAWTTDLPGAMCPNDWEFRLFDDDYDHFEQHMRQAIARVPALETVGVKQMINGPESFTPDGNFILGVRARMRQHVRRRRLQRLRHRVRRRRRLGAGAMGGRRRGAARPVGGRYPPLFQTCTATANGSATARSKPMASITRSAFRTRNTLPVGRASSRRSMSG